MSRTRSAIAETREELTSHITIAKAGLEDTKKRGVGALGRLKHYRDTIAKLERILVKLEKLDAAEIAEHRLSRGMYDPTVFSQAIFDSDPLDNIQFQLEVFSPTQISMPLRFLVNEPIGLWFHLNAAWKRDAPRAELLLIAEDHISIKDAIADIASMNKAAASKGLPDRQLAIRDLRTTWDHEAFVACAMLATTQAEGILWDLAKALQSRMPIFCEEVTDKGTIRRAILWDEDRGDYARDKDGRPKMSDRPLLSARMLLSQTRLGSCISREAYSYLIDEYYDNRNEMAHGSVSERPYRDDALAAILCIRAVYQEAIAALNRPDPSGKAKAE